MSKPIKIASIYPIESRVERRIYQGDFKIPAVERDAPPFILEIKDHYQYEPQPYFTGTVNGKQRMERKIVEAFEIANDIIGTLTQSHPDASPECHPGIWIVRETVPLSQDNGLPILDAENKPTFRDMTEAEKKKAWDEDLAANIEYQKAWGEKAIQKGNMMAVNPKEIPFIPPYCKILAVYYGQSPAWLNRITEGNIKSCRWCRKNIDRDAVVCPECGKTVDFERYAQMEAELKAQIERASKGVVTPPVKPVHAA